MEINKLIIENVKLHECLYNLKSKEYKNVQQKTKIWEQIGGLANMTGETCRKRWKGLRDTYQRRKRAAQLASASGAPNPLKKWKYMESLEFLDDYKDAQATIECVEDVENDWEHLLDCKSSTALKHKYSSTDEDPVQPHETPPKKYTKKHAYAEKTSAFKETKKECPDSLKEIAAGHANKQRDSTTVLFESLALKIKESNLPQLVVTRIEAKVVSLVYQEIAKNLKS